MQYLQLYHFPSLILNPFRRIRLLTATIHFHLLQCASLRSQVVYFLREVGESEQVECVVGSWCIATKDVDRQVALSAERSWDLVFSPAASSDVGLILDKGPFELLLGNIKCILFEYASEHAYLNPVQPASCTCITPRFKTEGLQQLRHQHRACLRLLTKIPDSRSLSEGMED